ncbi:MAG: hypothetical protein ACM3IJ_03735 [Candidatus Levyibacteriota bacterium]
MDQVNQPQESPTQTVASTTDAPKKGSKLPLVIIVLVVLLILAGAAFFFLSKNRFFSMIPNTTPPTPQVGKINTTPPVTQITPTEKPSFEIAADGSTQKKYINHKYGFSFSFPATLAENENVSVMDTGKIVYVYNTKTPYQQGQYVEIFEKSPSDSLDQAIKKAFLPNISEKDCFVATASADKVANFPANFEIRTLKFPVDEKSDVPAFAQPNKCMQPYAASNGLSYFLGDTKHPNVFFFFNIGQYGIDVTSPKKEGWQDTFQFLP